MASANDAFTGTAASNLSAHTSDSGHTWTKNASGGGHDILIVTAGNAVRASSNGSVQSYTSSFSPAAADYDVEAKINISGTGKTSISLGGRMTTDANQDGYYVYFEGSTASFYLWKRSAGTSGAVGSPWVPAGAALFAVKLQMRGTTIKVFVDGVERISATDSSITAAGKAGLMATGADSADTDYIDDWSATDAAAGGGGGAVFTNFMYRVAEKIEGFRRRWQFSEGGILVPA